MVDAAPVRLSSEQVLYFRARRSGLAGPGLADVPTTARALLGGQAQQLGPGLLALSQRTLSRPTARDLESLLFETPRRLVRTWGQRDTLHLYAVEDWPVVNAAMRRWRPGGRLYAIPAEEDLVPARRVIRDLGGVTRTDLEPVVRSSFLAKATERWGREEGARHFAASRLLWKLAQLGEVSLTEKRGAEQVYEGRLHAFPDLDFAELEPEPMAVELARRYLTVNGPATPQDLAHFFGAKVTRARAWVATLGKTEELLAVRCEGRELIALANDQDELLDSPPGDDRWPLRLLPLWDTLLMGHADKRWTVPTATEEKAIWRKAGVVAAVALHRGRIVATWSQKRRTHHLAVRVQPLSGWSRRRHLPALRREAEAVARHYGRSEAAVTID